MAYPPAGPPAILFAVPPAASHPLVNMPASQSAHPIHNLLFLISDGY